jgi:hypothetical protein
MAMAEIAANMVFSFNDGMVLIKGYVSFAIANIKPKPHVRLWLLMIIHQYTFFQRSFWRFDLDARVPTQ